MVISEFTLALLEDSGWYKTNYYTGGLMRYGKNKGCTFISNNCIDPNTLKTEFVNEFFDFNDMNLPSCSTGRLSRTYSIFKTYNTIDEKYSSNFIPSDRYYYSGAIYTTDYCFTHGPIPSESNSYYFTGNCKFGNGNYGSIIYYYNAEKRIYENLSNMNLPAELGETYSSNSFCVLSSLVPTGKYKTANSILHPMCYQMHCSSSFLTIQINNDYIVCPRTGGNVAAKGYDGKIHCPDYNLICTGTVLCNDIFDCIEKKSLVKDNTYNYDYTPITTQQHSKLSNLATLEAYELSDDGVCPLHCSQCSKNKKCKNCSSGYNLIGVEENDANSIICNNNIDVQVGYYKTNDDVYYLCHESCGTCSEKEKCITCKTNYYFLEESNIKKCYNKTSYPTGYYFNEEKNVFSKCHKYCETCSTGPISDNEMNCDSCSGNFVYNNTNKNCEERQSDEKPELGEEESKPKKKSKTNVFLAVFITLIIALLIVVGVVVYIIYKKKKLSDAAIANIEMVSEANSS